MINLSVLSSLIKRSVFGFELGAIRLPGRLPFQLLALCVNLKYRTFNLAICGMYFEREVIVVDYEGTLKPVVNFFWIGLRKCTMDYLRGEITDAED